LQQNGKAEHANRCIIRRVRAVLKDARAEEALRAEAPLSIIHVLKRSKVGGDFKPLEALTWRRPDLKELRF